MNETLEMIQNYAASGKYKRVPVSRELYADAFTPVSYTHLTLPTT